MAIRGTQRARASVPRRDSASTPARTAQLATCGRGTRRGTSKSAMAGTIHGVSHAKQRASSVSARNEKVIS